MQSKTLKRALGAVLLAGLCAESAAAQLTLRWDGGMLGVGVTYTISGSTKHYVLLPSLTPGPTALASVTPGDPRFLDVGLDARYAWRLGSLSGGPAQEHFLFPADPGASGLVLYAQAISFRGSMYFVDEISNRVSFVASLEGENHPTIDALNVPRREHTATAMADGRVLVVGGTTTGGTVTPSWELFDPQTQTFEPGGLMSDARTGHTATLLPNGSVLVVGGADGTGSALATTVLISPSGTNATAGPPLPGARVHHSATALADGRVLVVGGVAATSIGRPFGHPDAFQSAGPAALLLYDPATNGWTAGPSLPYAVVGHRADRLGDGRVVITGGVRLTRFPGTVANVWVFDPAQGTLDPAPALPTAMAFHLSTPTASGFVLVGAGSLVDPSVPSATGLEKMYACVLGAGQPASLMVYPGVPDAPGIIQGGEVICLPSDGYGFPSSPVFLPPILYFAGAGSSSVDLGAGTAVGNSLMMELDASLSTWTTRGPSLHERGGNRLTSIDGGFRILFSGSGDGGAEAKGEVRLRED